MTIKVYPPQYVEELEAELARLRELLQKMTDETEPKVHRDAQWEPPPGWCLWCDAHATLKETT